MMLIRIVAPHFVAGLEWNENSNQVIKAAPIIHYMMGWHIRQIEEYCNNKEWSMEVHGNV